VRRVVGEIAVRWTATSDPVACVATVIDTRDTLGGRLPHLTPILTAAQCVYDFDSGSWPYSAVFWPGDPLANPDRSWPITAAVVSDHFKTYGQAPDGESFSTASGDNFGIFYAPTALTANGDPDPSMPQSIEDYLGNSVVLPTVEFADQDLFSGFDARAELFTPNFDTAIIEHAPVTLQGYQGGSSNTQFYVITANQANYHSFDLRLGSPAFKGYTASGDPLIITTVANNKQSASTNINGVAVESFAGARFTPQAEYVFAAVAAVTAGDSSPLNQHVSVLVERPSNGGSVTGYTAAVQCVV
jgi:hypothetical protein